MVSYLLNRVPTVELTKELMQQAAEQGEASSDKLLGVTTRLIDRYIDDKYLSPPHLLFGILLAINVVTIMLSFAIIF